MLHIQFSHCESRDIPLVHDTIPILSPGVPISNTVAIICLSLVHTQILFTCQLQYIVIVMQISTLEWWDRLSNHLVSLQVNMTFTHMVNVLLINPRRACARVTVLGLSVCVSVCLSVCLSTLTLDLQATRRFTSSTN